MDKKEFDRNVYAAAFFVGGIFLILGVIFYIGQGRGLAQGRFPIQVLFRNVGGLSEGAQILLSGVNVGTVESIDFLDKDIETRRVSVVLSVYKKFKKQLAQSTRIVIKTQGILGDKLVEIYVDDNKPMVDLNKPIIGEDPLDVQDMTEVFVDAAEAFTKTSQDLNKIDIIGLTEMLQETSESLLITSRGINAILEDMDEVTRKSKRLLDRVEQRVIDGNLFKVF